jgi:hypothetical protein
MDESKKRVSLVVLLFVFVVNSVVLVGWWFLRQRFAPASVGLPGESASVLIAYEPFEYPEAAALTGQNGGRGFASAWEPGGFNATKSDVFHMRPGALSFSNLAVSGANHLSIEAPGEGDSSICGVGRFLGIDLAMPGSVYYLSFLYRTDAEGGYGSLVIGSGHGRELGIGRSRSAPQFHLAQRGGLGRAYAEDEAVVGQTVFMVVKMEFMEGPDRFVLFMNPRPGHPEPPTGVIKEDMDLGPATHFFLYSRSAWSVDEIRLGKTWADVTPAR